MSEEDRFRESYSNLRMAYQSYSIPWYQEKKRQYSNPLMYQPIKLAVLKFLHETGATPYRFDYLKYEHICKNLGVRQVENVSEYLKDLYIDFADYLYKKQFGKCLKYPDGSLVLFSYRHNGSLKIAYRESGGSYYDFYSKLELPFPESFFSLSGNAMTQSGNIVSVEKLKKVRERKTNDNSVQTKQRWFL